MKLLVAVAVSCSFVIGCRGDIETTRAAAIRVARPSVGETQYAVSTRTLEPAVRTLSPREEELTTRLEGMVPKELGAQLRHTLMDPHMGSLSIHNRPAVQAILDSIADLRIAAMRADIAAREKAQAMHVTATLAMTDEWTDASASAVAVYRPGKTPENVIFLPRNAAPGNVAAGIRALSALRKRETSTNRESRLVAHERSIPDSWKADRTDRVMLEYLSDLSSQPTATITGQVRARTLQLPIRLK